MKIAGFAVKKKSRTLGQAGFSLIELMTVVAIIGLLSSIAVPNYKKMVAKARRSEAKAALGAIYTAEKSHAAEYTNYTVCLFRAGYEPEGEFRYYSSGFWMSSPAADTAWEFNGEACNYGSIPWKGSTRNDGIFIGSAPHNSCINNGLEYGASLTTFTAAAMGRLTENPNCDIVTINDRKEVVNVQDGT